MSKKNIETTDDLKALKSSLFGLTMCCPFTSDNPLDCQFHAIRLSTNRDKLKWVNSLSQHELKLIHKKHKTCLSEKENT